MGRNKIFYSILQGDEFVSVTGFQLTPHFAARVENGWGYRVTHLRTGWLLTTIGFSTIELATQFAELVETTFGKDLDRADVRILRDAATTPPKKRLHEVIWAMNNLSLTKRVINDADLNEIVEKMPHG